MHSPVSPLKRRKSDLNGFRDFLLLAATPSSGPEDLRRINRRSSGASAPQPRPSLDDSDLVKQVEELKNENNRLRAEQGATRLAKHLGRSSSVDHLDLLLQKTPQSLDDYRDSIAKSAKYEGYRVAGVVERARALKARRQYIEQQLYLIDNPPVIIPEGRPEYMSLREEDRERAQELVYYLQPSEVVAEKFGLKISGGALECLRKGQWLNDEVINFYFQLIQERSAFRSSFAWNTFFWQKLSEDGRGYTYKNVQRWSTKKKVDIFSYELMLVPINVGKNHWALGSLTFRIRPSTTGILSGAITSSSRP